MKITYNPISNLIEIRAGYSPDMTLDIKKLPGRVWNPAPARFWTVPAIPDLEVPLGLLAARWGGTLDPKLKAFFSLQRETKKTNLKLSIASKPMKRWSPNNELSGKLRPFQAAGVQYLIRNRRVLLADEMGLGKTVEAIVGMVELGAFPCLVVCPASLKYNWKNEIEKWIPAVTVKVLGAGDDSFQGHFVIVNYDILAKYESLFVIPWKGLIVDESHYIKNYQAQRTKLVQELSKDVTNIFLLSGTPATNRPADLATQLAVIGALGEFGGFWEFMKRYAKAHKVEYRPGKWGWDFSGAAYLDELNIKMREFCYIRRNKAEVLPELPAKVVSVLEVEISTRPEYERAAADVVNYIRHEKRMERKLMEEYGIDNPEFPAVLDAWRNDKARKAARAKILVKISTCKQIIALGKAWAIRSWIASFFEQNPTEKLVVFGWHTDVILDVMTECSDLLAGGYPVMLVGDTSSEERAENVRLFQEDENCKAIFLSIPAGGVGLTLTASHWTLFIEQGWTPAEMLQAEDRTHRISQEADSVNIVYMLGRNTLDMDIREMILSKQEVISQAVDGFESLYAALERDGGKWDGQDLPEPESDFQVIDEQNEVTTIENMIHCNNCGAFAPVGKPIKHYDNCQPGESKRWERFYNEGENTDVD